MSPQPKELRDYEAEFTLTSGERAEYGATITARDQDTGRTRTFAKTHMTALDATTAIIGELDLLIGDWRILTISTPVSIGRDVYANRIAVNGIHSGETSTSPEAIILGRLKRMDMLADPPPWRLAAYAGPEATA